jgi:predicted protein tyrosine phosphatase
MKILFLCGRAQIRSPTAERIFADLPGVETRSAGVSADADEVVSADDIDWADVVVCMERTHSVKLKRKFDRRLRDKRVVVLDVEDEYDYMADDLVTILHERVPARVKGMVGT